VPSSAGDAELVALCRDGDESAWAELVERFSHYVYAIAKRGLRLSEADAEDVFQEVFARLFERLDDLRDDTAVRPYIAQVTRRVALDRHRAMAKVEPHENPPEPAPLNGDLLERLDEAMEVREALAMLPERCQEILDRFFVRDESYLMIAEALDIPPGTVASRISRCLARLRREMEERTTRTPASLSGQRAAGSLPRHSTSMR